MPAAANAAPVDINTLAAQPGFFCGVAAAVVNAGPGGAGNACGGPPPVAAAVAVVVGPAELAREAFAQVAPSVPGVDFAPRFHPDGGESTLVGVKTFVWVAPGGLAPIVRRAAAGGNWAQVTARVSSVSFDPGDGSAAVTCPGGGTPYDPAASYTQQKSACWHVYSTPSTGAGFRLAATVTWSATWTGAGGAGGVLPPVAVNAAVAVPVQEMQALNN